jgi:hypothetical protein
MEKIFCFFFQKEVLSSCRCGSLKATWYQTPPNPLILVLPRPGLQHQVLTVLQHIHGSGGEWPHARPGFGTAHMTIW